MPVLRGTELAKKPASLLELAVNPNDYSANFYLGYLKRRNREYDAALSFFQKALRLRPGNGAVHYQISLIHNLKGKLDEAQRVLESVVKKDPEYTDAWVTLARICYKKRMTAQGESAQKVADALRAKEQETKEGGSGRRGSELDVDKRPVPPPPQ